MYQVRKLGVVAKAVDPVLVADALTAINTGLMAVVATLRVKFAQCVTLGVTVGGIAHNIVSTHIEPVRIGRFPNPGTLFYLSAGDCCPYIAIYKTDSFRSTKSGSPLRSSTGASSPASHWPGRFR
jgi:hypothetical protein